MDSNIFYIIIIVLVVVVLFHLIHNSSNQIDNFEGTNTALFDQQLYDKLSTDPECTDDTDSTCDSNCETDCENGCRLYDDGKYRDPGTVGLDRTDKSKSWYHVANVLVPDEYLGRCKSRCDGDYDVVTAKAINRLSKNKDKYKRNKKGKKRRCLGTMVFGGNYDGVLINDPFDADKYKNSVPFCARPKKPCPDPDEMFVDVYGDTCKINEDSREMKRYIRDNVLDGKAQCGCVIDKSKSEFKRSEVDTYRQDYLNFMNKINGTSDPAVDAVDRINEITLHGGIKADGQTISSTYDNLIAITTEGVTPKPQLKCVSGSISDQILQPFCTGPANGGRYIMADSWMYPDENPSNGGVVFDGILGNDTMMNKHAMV